MIEPGGRAVSYAELAARADQYGRGLQALGLRPGDSVAGLLPNGTEALALFFAALQTGLYVVPVNWHLAGAEVAYILADSGAGAFVAHERFGAVAADAAGQAGIGPGTRFAVGAIPGFTPLAALGAASQGRPGAADRGRPHGVHLGHVGPAQGRAAPADRRGPGPAAPGVDLVLRHLRARAARRPRAPVLLAAVPHGGAELRHDLGPARPPGRAHGPVRRAGTARAGRTAPGDPHAHGADPVPPPARAARGGAGPVRRVARCGPRSTAPRPARRTSSGR